MSVLLVTDDVDDDIRKYSLDNPHEYIYKQLKELEYDLLPSVRSFSIVDSSLSIFGKSNKYYQQHRRRRRRCRPQQCLVQHLLTYMLTLLILTNHLHWPVLVLSLSSIKIMSTHASAIAITTTSIRTATATIKTTAISSSNQILSSKRPLLTPSTDNLFIDKDEQQCFVLNGTLIDRICSKTCRARRTPFEKFDDIKEILSSLNYAPFCSNISNQSIVRENFFIESDVTECRETLNNLLKSDNEARTASSLFATYMEAIDSASEENRYSIIPSDCQEAYKTWACAVKIPFYYQNHLIPPCQTICDAVERVCPTFRPSDREPLFAGQPLFFCHGGIVANSDYGKQPHCFDTCHLFGGSLQHPSSMSASATNPNYSNSRSIATAIEHHVTTPTCFKIEPLSPSSSEHVISSHTFVNESISANTSNTSLSSSARTIIPSYWLSVFLTFNFVFKWKFLQEF